MFTVRLKDRDARIADLPTLARMVKAGQIDANAAVYDHLREEWTLAGTVTAPPKRPTAPPLEPSQMPVAASPPKPAPAPPVAAPPKPAPTPVITAPQPTPAPPVAAPPKPAPTPQAPVVEKPATTKPTPDDASPVTEPAWAREPFAEPAKRAEAPALAAPKAKPKTPAAAPAGSPMKKKIERWATRAAAAALLIILAMTVITYIVETKDHATAAAAAAKVPPTPREPVTPIAQTPDADESTPEPAAFSGGQFDGAIGKREISLKLDVTAADRTLAGSFRYDGKGPRVPVTGTYDADRHFALAEKIEGKVVAEITGTMTSDSLTGEWRTKSGKRTLAFHVTRSD